MSLKGIYGIAYSCSNADETYCKDWASDAMKSRFGQGGKNDIRKLKELGFNILRLYYLDPANNHQLFLKECEQVGMGIEIPIHNGLIEKRDDTSIRKLVNEVKNSPAVKYYTVGNEMNSQFNDSIIWAINLVNQIDPNRSIMHSSIFDNNFETMKQIIYRLPQGLRSKYIAGINMYFFSNPPQQAGDCIQGAVIKWYNDPDLKDLRLIISETGYAANSTDDNQWISFHNTLYGSFMCYDRHPLFLGIELFANQDEQWKHNFGHNEHLYGIMDEFGNPKKAYYAIDNFKNQDPYKQMIYKYKI